MKNLAQMVLERRREPSDQRGCSFHRRSEGRVGKLIAGPGVHICDECVELCNEILEQERSQGRV